MRMTSLLRHRMKLAPASGNLHATVACETKHLWEPDKEESVIGCLARFFPEKTDGKEEFRFECGQISLLRNQGLKMSAVFKGSKGKDG